MVIPIPVIRKVSNVLLSFGGQEQLHCGWISWEDVILRPKIDVFVVGKYL